MTDILLNCVFKIDTLLPIASADLSFLKKVTAITKPKEGSEAGFYTITDMSKIAEYTDNKDVEQLFKAGMSSIFLLTSDDLNVGDVLKDELSNFYTILISSDFNDEEVEAKDFGLFDGVIGVSFIDQDKAKAFNIVDKQSGWISTEANGAKNMFYGFGSFLSSNTWRNQQYIEMPFDDSIDTLGEAELLFDDRVSFVITSPQFGNRLSLFAVGKRAIIAPYIIKEIEVNLQSKALTYLNLNQPDYTTTQGILLQNYLQTKVLDSYIDNALLTKGLIEISVDEDSNFVANATININEPKALWRIFGTMKVGE